MAVVGDITENAEILGSAQVQENSSSKLLEALENFVKKIDSVYKNINQKPFNLTDLSKQMPNIAFNISRQLFTNEVFFIAREIEGNVSVSISTNSNQTNITSETVAIIKIPGEVLTNTPETLYSYQFRKPSLFLSETQLQQLNGHKTKSDQTVDSNVLSATVLLKSIRNLTNSVVLTFRLSEKQREAGSVDCQFWNPSLGK